MQRRTFELRKSLVLLRRVVLPMREVLNSLLRRDLHVVDGEILPYFHDVYDHVLRATEWTESLRDLVTTILETHLTVRGNRLNVIMKQVTSWAAIIAVPTAVTGFYGQNVPYPGFGHTCRFLDVHPHHDWAVRGPVCHLPPQGLAVTGWRAAGPEFAALTRNRLTRDPFLRAGRVCQAGTGEVGSGRCAFQESHGRRPDQALQRRGRGPGPRCGHGGDRGHERTRNVPTPAGPAARPDRPSRPNRGAEPAADAEPARTPGSRRRRTGHGGRRPRHGAARGAGRRRPCRGGRRSTSCGRGRRGRRDARGPQRPGQPEPGQGRPGSPPWLGVLVVAGIVTIGTLAGSARPAGPPPPRPSPPAQPARPRRCRWSRDPGRRGDRHQRCQPGPGDAVRPAGRHLPDARPCTRPSRAPGRRRAAR